MSEEKISAKIPYFDGHHYDHWSELMENLLRAKGLWKLVESGVDEPRGAALTNIAEQQQLESDKLKDHKVKHYLFRAIDRAVFEQILDRSTSKVVWDSLKRKYGGNDRVKRSLLNSLRRDFEVLEMKEGETITEYFSRVMAVANKMRSNGEEMPDSKVVQKILRTLTDRFTYVVVSIEESKDTESLSIDELQSSLVIHEQKFKRVMRYDSDQALKVEDQIGGRGRGRGSFRGRGRGRGRQTFNKATVECFKCHNLGHFQYECPQWNKEANYVEVDKDEELLLMAYVEKLDAKRSDAWFIDSGCSNHMCGDKGMFSNLVEELRHSVKCGNNTRMTVAGKGSVKLMFNGLSFVIRDVYYVPELRNNLLSVGQLQEKGVAIVINNGSCSMYHPDKRLIAHTKMSSNRMFVLINDSSSVTKPLSEECLLTSSSDLTHLWHQRYGHLSFKGLRLLQSKKMVHGLPDLKASKAVCAECLTGKQHRNAIPKKSEWRAKKVLELVHADICGPIDPISNSGKRYILCFIDDYSRKAWVYLLNEKSEALECFKNYKKMVEKEVEQPIKCLRTDRGGEFTSLDFKAFCQEEGIKRQLTTAYTPHQNGVAERKNRTVMNMARCMLAAKKMPKSFWTEAVNWTFYLLNRCPTFAVKNITPQEAWSGVKPSVDHFRVWGCVAHVHVPDAKRGKLDNKSFPCIFLGVSEESKGYRLFDPKTRRIVVSKDVIFEEERNWEWEKEFRDQIGVQLEWGDDDLNGDENEGETENQINDDGDVSDGSVGDIEFESSDENSEVRSGEGISQGTEAEGRERRQPRWMGDYVSGEGLSEGEEAAYMIQDVGAEDPTVFEDAVKEEKWRKAMDDEIKSIEKNRTWELVNLPPGAKAIGVKWIFKTKLNEHGEVDKYKARLVAKGYSQQQGVDFTEVFAPVARMDTIRLILAIASCKGWTVLQLDVKSAFLHGEINEDVYVDQPKGYVREGSEHKVYKLQKALYGLKQAPRAWFSRIEAHFLNEGFKKCPNEQTLFTKRSDEGKWLIVSIYVDDLIYTSEDEGMMTEFKKSMMKAFDMTDLGKMRFFLGIEVLQKPTGIFICQRRYANDVLKRFGMSECKPVSSPIVSGFKIGRDVNGVAVDDTFYKQIVGSLMYLTATRPDIMFSVSLISRYMSKPTELHLQAAKRILRYLRGTTSHGIFYKKGGKGDLVVFTDSDYAGDEEDSKSTSGYVFLLSSGAVSWMSKKQPIVTLSTTEAEFVAAAACACQAIWIRRVLKNLSYVEQKVTNIMCDNTSTIKLSKNPIMHGRSKHIRVRFHFLRDLVKDGKLELVHCGTKEQVADVMTKALKLETFLRLKEKLGMCDLTDLN